jgi:hypothetical protein
LCVGYSRSGQSLAQFLEQESISIITPLMPTRCASSERRGGRFSGVRRCTSPQEVLTAAGLSRAAAIVVSLPTLMPPAVRPRTTPGCAEVIVRTFDDTDVDKLKESRGAAEIGRNGGGRLALVAPDHATARHSAQQSADAFAHGAGWALSVNAAPGATDASDTALDAQQPRLQSIIVEARCAAAIQQHHPT